MLKVVEFYKKFKLEISMYYVIFNKIHFHLSYQLTISKIEAGYLTSDELMQDQEIRITCILFETVSLDTKKCELHLMLRNKNTGPIGYVTSLTKLVPLPITVIEQGNRTQRCGLMTKRPHLYLEVQTLNLDPETGYHDMLCDGLNKFLLHAYQFIIPK